MAIETRMSAGELGAALRVFLEQAVAGTPAQEPTFVGRLREHLGVEPTKLAILVEELDVAERPNVQAALEAYLGAEQRSAELVGLVGPYGGSDAVRLASLVATGPANPAEGGATTQGPIAYVNVRIGDDRVVRCLRSCLLLVRDGASRLAVLVDRPSQCGPWERLRVEVMSPEGDAAERFLAELRSAMRQRNVYRGRVLTLGGNGHDDQQVQVRRLPTIERDQIVLPAGVLERVERQTLTFARHSQRLLAAGRHLKRGILLHGPPGTGKTLTAMYLAGQMPDRTTLLLTWPGLGCIERCCAIARSLQPAMIVLEDVDLVAEERTRPGASCNPLLFALLDQMDGLAEDADVIFVLTTNRPDLIEPALASRPGRIDQTVEIGLPDAAGRRRLLELYARGLTLAIDDPARFVARTEGASAAFMRELLRRAALFAAEEERDGIVEERHLSAALDELLVAGGELTRNLLGVRSRPAGRWHYDVIQRGRSRRANRIAAG